MGFPSSRVEHLSFWCAATLAVVLTQCGTDDGGSSFPNGGDAGVEGGNTPGSGTFGNDSCDGPCPATDDAGPGTTPCGDGSLAPNEECDDNNNRDGDGCSATCKIEPGYVCPTPGLKCEAAKCGDKILAGKEECELPDGVETNGCTADCKIKPGFDCDPTTFVCSEVHCGDGIVSRGESCEDNNDLPFDGCFNCQKEPSCVNGVCQGACGDGQRFNGEECDDGNTRDGDGCSSTCKIETGFKCTDVVGDPPETIDLHILMRDFVGVGNGVDAGLEHTDFNQLNGSGVTGIVDVNLDDAGRPTLACDAGDCSQNPGHLYFGGAARPNISTLENFQQWYRPNAFNKPSVFTTTLTRDASTGLYQWDSAKPAQNGGKNYFDPIGTGGWVDAGLEKLVCDPARNCSFTSETHFWFEYQGGEHFAFSGDDDTWIFVNRKLVVDLGGLHVRRNGSFDLDPQSGVAVWTTDMPATANTGTVDLGLTKGGVYEVVMFQAERNQCGSNFTVSLKDFNRPKSTCASECGDGIVASDEVCDDGKNDGTYGGCMPGCKARGPRCGDGIKQDGEECDDGNSNNNDTCTNGCRKTTVN